MLLDYVFIECRMDIIYVTLLFISVLCTYVLFNKAINKYKYSPETQEWPWRGWTPFVNQKTIQSIGLSQRTLSRRNYNNLNTVPQYLVAIGKNISTHTTRLAAPAHPTTTRRRNPALELNNDLHVCPRVCTQWRPNF